MSKHISVQDGGWANRSVLAAFLLLLIILSSLAVIYSSYQTRQLFAELQRQQREAVRLEEDWGRLLLEQSTWASHARIEQLAQQQLGMKAPELSHVVIVR